MALTRPKIWDLDTNVSFFTDAITVLHQGATSADTDVGFLFNRANGLVSNVALYWSESSKTFVTALTSNSGVTTGNISVTGYANLTIGSAFVNGTGVFFDTGAGIRINGSYGSAGQSLTSDGTGGLVWSTGGFSGGYVSSVTTFGSNLVANSTTASSSTTTGALVVVGGAGISGAVYAGSDISGSRLVSTNSTGNEGGEIQLALAATNNNLTTSISIDVYTNKLRIFETGGTNRGAYIDLTEASAGVGTNLLTPQKLVNGTTSITALASGDANVSVSGVSNVAVFSSTGLTVTQNLNVTGISTFTGNVNSGHIIPRANVTYDLGSPTARFRSLYITGSTIDMDGATISTSAGQFNFNAAGGQLATGRFATVTSATVNAATIGNSGATLTGTIQTAAQTNITSVGTLTGLTVSGNTAIDNTLYGRGVYDNSNRVLSTTNGAGNLTISGTAVGLTATGPGVVTTGSATAIPVITTDAYGRISAITTAAVSSTLNIAGTTGTGTVSLTSQTLTVAAGTGVTTAASGQTITVSIPQAVATSSTPTFAGLTVNGTITATTVNAATIGNASAALTGGTLNISAAGSVGTLVATNFSTGNTRISAGYADNFAIGANTRATAAFTTLTATGNVDLQNTVYGRGVYDNSVRVVSTSTGAGNLTISSSAVNLTAVGPGAASVGSSTAIPVITTDAYGRVAGTTTAAVVAPAGTLTGATLAAGVTASSLTSVGRLTGLTVDGIITATTVNAGTIGNASATLTGGQGSISGGFSVGTLVATNFSTGNAQITSCDTTNFDATTGVITNFSSGNTRISAGYADNFAIGGNTATNASFTTLTASGITQITNSTNNNGTAYTSGALQVTGGAGIGGHLYVQGNLYVSNIVATTSQTLSVVDPLLYLTASNPATYNYEIGTYSHFGSGSAYQHTGIVRDHNDNTWKIFGNVPEPAAGAITFTNATYDAVKAGSLTLANTAGTVLTVGGNTAVTSTVYTNGLYDSGNRVLSTSAGAGNLTISSSAVNLTAVGPGAATTGSGSAIPVITTDAYGRVAGITTASLTAITNLSSSGVGNITVSAATGSSTISLPATGPGAASVGSSTAIPVITTDAYGRIAGISTAAVVAPAGTLSGATLASGVTASSLTSLGVITSLSATTAVATNFSTGNAVITSCDTSTLDATTGVITNFSTGNARITGGYADNLPIGANTKATGAFTTLIATGNVDLQNTVYGRGIYDNSVRVVSTSTGAGNLTISSGAINLPATGPGAASVGSSTAIPVITTDAYGRIAATSTAAVVAPAGTLSGTTLASGVTASSLTSVGRLTGLIVDGTITATTVNAGIIGNTSASIIGATGRFDTSITTATLNAATIGNASAAHTGGTLNISGGGSVGTLVATNFSTGNAVITSCDTSTLDATTGVITNFSSGNIVGGSTSSTSTGTGALVVSGGIGVGGNIYAGKIYTTNGVYWSGNGTSFSSGSGGGISYTAAATAPTSPNAGDFWYNSATDVLFQRINDGTNSQWVDQSAPTTFSTLTVSGTTYHAGSILPTANASINIGSTTAWFNLFYGKSVQAQYADLAEKYLADAEYLPGTVVVFGGEQEITVSDVSHDTRVAGVISTDPAYLMNAAAHGLPVAFTGRVPCQVQGPVRKGDVLVNVQAGVAGRMNPEKYQPGCIIGKSLQNISSNTIEIIEVAVGRY